MTSLGRHALPHLSRRQRAFHCHPGERNLVAALPCTDRSTTRVFPFLMVFHVRSVAKAGMFLITLW